MKIGRSVLITRLLKVQVLEKHRCTSATSKSLSSRWRFSTTHMALLDPIHSKAYTIVHACSRHCRSFAVALGMVWMDSLNQTSKTYSEEKLATRQHSASAARSGHWHCKYLATLPALSWIKIQINSHLSYTLCPCVLSLQQFQERTGMNLSSTLNSGEPLKYNTLYFQTQVHRHCSVGHAVGKRQREASPPSEESTARTPQRWL